MSPRLLCGCASINHQLRSRDKGSLIGGQVKHAIGYVLGGPDSAQRYTMQGLLTTGLTGQGFLAHGGINGARVNGVTAYLIFGVLNGSYLGEQAYCALGCVISRGA